MKIYLRDLARACDILFDHLNKSGEMCFDIDGDIDTYWDLSCAQRYDMDNLPEILVGSLLDDLSEIYKINNRDICSLNIDGFFPITSLITYLALKDSGELNTVIFSNRNKKEAINKTLLNEDILFFVQRALLGEISTNVRKIYVSWDEGNIEITWVFDGQVSEKDEKSVLCVEGQVIADVSENINVSSKYETIKSPKRIICNNSYIKSRSVFARRES